MIVNAAHDAIRVDASTGLVAMVTLVTALVFGLITLARPSRATITWGVAFGLGLLGTYLWVGAQQMDSAVLQAAASGFMICFEPIIWLGLRMHFGKRPIWWPVVAFVLIVPAVLAVSADGPGFQPVFRAVFLVAGVFAALIAYELFRNPSPRRDIKLPLALASCAFAILAVVGAAATLFDTELSLSVQLDVLREINSVGTLVTSVCAAFTLVLLVRADGQQVDTAALGAVRARRRLQKARLHGDQAWSILDVRLDDTADLRESTTGVGFGRIVDRFHDDIIDSLPAAADADRVDDDRCIVIIHGSDESVQHHVRTMLRRISTIGGAGASAGIRLSASVGWAGVSVVGYDYDELIEAAAQAAARARDEGGDRWERVKKAPTTLER
ncbi:hypothetical protein [Microbacterium sp.]|uniref:hypothetical protein n=1 Tax=Microbacterium sp. TaxID=51671 RepID=UPI002CD3C705|nr:hypothetical protein [Microbacterium sp.]HWK76618.1 hypothetical protein [Microbacterium sp.]